ncbi:MAG: putative collagen-binding domain-containing protein [Candidatus Rokuibacteriota bacterium]
MIRIALPRLLALLTLLSPALVPAAEAGPARGPLVVGEGNPRYFSDPAGRPVYLTGSHHWQNFQDGGDRDEPPAFDYEAYLGLLERHGHNLIRLWAWEHAAWKPWATGNRLVIGPLLYGHGPGPDGRPRFDLDRFDEAYFARLRERVIAARDRGIYVMVMLFQGWSIETKGKGRDPWRGHPYHRDNNVNGIDGDPDGDGAGMEVHTLKVPAVTRLQERYVAAVVARLNDLDNVLWEISNESHTASTEWHAAMIRHVRKVEAALPRRHPVVMTAQYPRGQDGRLFESRADAVSPSHPAYRSSPPPADGRKVIISDTDHLWGVGGDPGWVWKSFTRGHNPIVMDPYPSRSSRRSPGDEGRWEAIRRAMGDTRRYARRMNLAAATPRTELASTGYCLANPDARAGEYLVYVPRGGSVAVNLSATPERLAVEWFDPATGDTTRGGSVPGGAWRSLAPPFRGAAVLYLYLATGAGPRATEARP